MRKACCLLSASLVLATAAAAMADDKRDCFGHGGPGIRIKSCSILIERDPKDHTAYYYRGLAYGVMGDVERAIADYAQAIALNPNDAAAYESRGRAYASKGDYANALADVTKASEIQAEQEVKRKHAAWSAYAKGPRPGSRAPAPKLAKASRKPKPIIHPAEQSVKPVYVSVWPEWALRSSGTN